VRHGRNGWRGWHDGVVDDDDGDLHDRGLDELGGVDRLEL
jgi:hypothetical protein